jgi:hypothetical protein
MDHYIQKWTIKTGSYGQVSQYRASRGKVNTTGLLVRGDTKKFNDVVVGLSYLCKTCQKPKTKERLFSLTQLKSLTDPDNYRKTEETDGSTKQLAA